MHYEETLRDQEMGSGHGQLMDASNFAFNGLKITFKFHCFSETYLSRFGETVRYLIVFQGKSDILSNLAMSNKI